MKISKILLLFFICKLFLLSTTLHSQALNTPVKISFGEYNGFAFFDFETKGKDTILNGKFSFEGPIIDTFNIKFDEFFSFKGNFKNNKPVESWEFILTNIKGFNKTVLSKDYLTINIDALIHQINGSFNDNDVKNNWRHQVFFKKNNQNSELLYSSEIQKLNQNENSLILKTKDLQLNAPITKANLADSIWVWDFKKDSLNLYWEFKNGLLFKVSQNNNQWDIFKLGSEDAIKFNTLELSKKYIEVLKIKLAIAGCRNENEESLSVISTLDSLEMIRKNLTKTVNGNYFPQLTFKLPFAELKPIEKSSLKMIVKTKSEIDSIFNSINQIKNIKDFQKGFPEVISLLDSINLIQSNQYKVINEISKIYNNGLMPFFNRDELITHFLNKQIMKQNIKKDSIYDLNFLVAFTNSNYKEVKSLNDKIVYYNNKREKQKELLELEKQMISKKKIFEIAIDSAFIKTPTKYQNALIELKKYGDSLISEYWSTNSILQKLNLAEKNITCFSNLFNLTQTLSSLSSQQEKIIQFYTDSSFNVFTSTNLEYVSKKKIIYAYSEILIPNFYQLINSSISCDNVFSINKMIINTNKRLFELKNEKTKSIEAELSSKNSYTEILELFGISSVIK